MKRSLLVLTVLLVVGFFGVASQSQSITIDPSTVNVSPSETATLSVEISGLTNGLERVNVDLEISSDCAADLTGVAEGDLSGFTYLTTTDDISSDGKSVTLSAFTMSEYTGTGGIVYTLEVTGKSSGSTSCPITIIKNNINDKGGSDISDKVTVENGNLNVQKDFELVDGNFLSDWNLFSPPGIVQNPDPFIALGDDIGIFKLYYNYSTNSGYTVNFGSKAEFTWKQGYWLNIDSKAKVDMKIRKPSAPKSIHFNDKGWHLIGVPANYDWSNIGVRQGNSQTMTIAKQADGPSAPHWMSRFLWEYDPGTKTYTAYDASNGSYTMEKWEGYWIKTREDNVTLVIPYDSFNSITTRKNQTNGISMNSFKAEKLDIPNPPSPPGINSVDRISIQVTPNPITSKDRVNFLVAGPKLESFQVDIYNPSGKQIHTSKPQKDPTYTWKPKTTLTNGLYLYQITAHKKNGQNITETSKLLVLQ